MYRSIILGAVIAFVWSWISWVVLPWHECGISSFKNEKAVAHVIRENAPHAGLYTIPSCCFSDKSLTKEQKRQAEEMWKQGPVVMAAVRPHGIQGNMTKELIFHFLTCLGGAAILTGLLCCFGRAFGYWKKVSLVTFAVLAGVFLSEVPLWTWHGFSAGFVTVNILDLTVGWFLAGLAMAAFIKPQSVT